MIFTAVAKGRNGRPCLPGGVCSDSGARCIDGMCRCAPGFYEKAGQCGELSGLFK